MFRPEPAIRWRLSRHGCSSGAEPQPGFNRHRIQPSELGHPSHHRKGRAMNTARGHAVLAAGATSPSRIFGERVPVVRRNRLDAGEQCAVGGQGVVALCDRAMCRPVGGVTPR
jgi:hypothetical protein